MKKSFAFIVFISTFLVDYTVSECNVCSSVSSIACVSETDFKVCFNNGSPSEKTYSCPDDSVCTGTVEMCSSGGTSPACIPACGNCGADGRFACINETHLSLCFGEADPPVGSPIVPCPQNTVCSNSLLNFCGDAAKTVPDCKSDTTTIPNSTTATPICTGPGRFPIQSEDCKKYVYCYFFNGQLRSQIYTCQGNTIFNASKQQCIVPTSTFSCA